MSTLLFQDDILPGMDVYVDYTIDLDARGGTILREDIIVLDWGLELDHWTVLSRNDNGTVKERVRSTTKSSLRGYINTEWMRERLIDEIYFEIRGEEA